LDMLHWLGVGVALQIHGSLLVSCFHVQSTGIAQRFAGW
jgi:hypothetical protein